LAFVDDAGTLHEAHAAATAPDLTAMSLRAKSVDNLRQHRDTLKLRHQAAM
jgi:hypothetical protein